MNTKNWEKVSRIVAEALDLDEDQRPDFVRERCADQPKIRQEVESLLSNQAGADNFFDEFSIDNYAELFQPDEDDHSPIGQQIGNYRIIREIGRGGMGAVYLGERFDGKFEQQVALKLLKRELNTKNLRRRFQHERQILAQLVHPNIARLLDAGATADAVPFLAMEYIEGVPIDVYCNKHNLDLKQRLNLFRQICEAVAFAHRKLVVHRDLKPSNILVGADGIPKLLDFGIAKLLTREYAEQSEHTVTQIGAMTPAYASPEQLRQETVSTATDVYSLGVILYELLSGHRPFESAEGNFQEIFNAVCENEPTPPSAIGEIISAVKQRPENVSTQLKASEKADDFDAEAKPDAQTKTNRLRLTAPQFADAQSLRGDLDNIVLKALKKEPERRYSTVEFFSEDVRRHLAGLPVSARPDTFAYRLEKFVKRHRAGVLAGAVILLAILGGLIATLWQARIARAERAKAERRFKDVRKLANSYLFDIFPEIENLEGSLKARGKILQTALEYLDSLSQEAEGDAELQLELATAYEKIGEVQGAVNISNLGDLKAGLESYKKAQKLREAVFAGNASEPKNKEALSKNYQITAQSLMWNIDTAQAAEYYEKAIKLRRELIAANSESPDLQNRLAVLLTDYAAIPIVNVENEKAALLLDEASAIIKSVLANHPEHFYTRKAYPRLLRAASDLKTNAGDYEGAIRDIDESVRLTGELIREKPEDYSLRRTAWLNDSHYCQIFLARGDGRKTVESCLKTVDFNVKALEKEPGESFALYDLAMSHYYIAQGFRLSNDSARAVEYTRKALEPLAKLNQTSPGINDYMRGTAVVEQEIADSLLMLGNTDESLKYLQSAQTKMETVTQTDKTVNSYKIELAKIYLSIRAAYQKKADAAKASEFLEKARSLVRPLRDQNRLRESDRRFFADLEQEKAH